MIIISKDSAILKLTMEEMLVENQVIVSDEQAERRNRLEAIIEADFAKYDEVFRALV